MKTGKLEAVMKKVRAAFEKSELSLDELGRRMGYEKNQRQSAFQFLKETSDPRLSMLLRFADAVGTDAKDLL